MKTVTSHDGTTIAYDLIGTGPAVILVDGAMCYRGFGPMGALADALAPGFTVLTYDRRGRGASGDTAPYAIEREVDDLAALLDVAGGSAFAYGLSSGAVLLLHAATRGLTLPRLALFEPPPSGGNPTSSPAGGDLTSSPAGLSGELAAMVAAGRRGDAVERFQAAVGVPAELIAGMRNAPFRSTMEAIAPTLVYDTMITASRPALPLWTIATPILAVHSEGSPAALRASTREVADALPDARLLGIKGQFHDVPAEDLAPVLTEFFAS